MGPYGSTLNSFHLCWQPRNGRSSRMVCVVTDERNSFRTGVMLSWCEAYLYVALCCCQTMACGVGVFAIMNFSGRFFGGNAGRDGYEALLFDDTLRFERVVLLFSHQRPLYILSICRYSVPVRRCFTSTPRLIPTPSSIAWGSNSPFQNHEPVLPELGFLRKRSHASVCVPTCELRYRQH